MSAKMSNIPIKIKASLELADVLSEE